MNNPVINFVLGNYIWLALGCSLFYGFFAERIFGNKIQREEAEKEFGWLGHIHQFWLNFVGSAVGWFSFYLFINVLKDIGLKGISFSYILLLVIGTIGIIGWLPLTLMGVIKSLTDVVKRLIDKI